MSKDNTLGAPTEGLGQTVTFTTNGGGGIPQLQTTSLQGLRAEQRGGEARLTAAPVQIPDAMAGAGVLNAIAKIGGGLFNEAIERERKEAYMTGVRRVVSGEAVKEIVDEQPWVSKLFGPTPAIEGARAYAGSTLAQKAAMEAEQELKQLQEVSPQEYQSYITQKLNGLKSGDDSTDFIAQQAFAQEVPGLVKAHSKAHLVWQQGELARQASSNQEVAASRYAGIAARYDSTVQAEKLLNGDDAEAFMDENDLLESKIKFVQAFALPPGIPKETHDKLTAKTIGAVLARGDLSSYYVLEDAGVVRDLGPDNEKRLREQADRVESRKRAELPASFAEAYGKIKAMPTVLSDPTKFAENLETLKTSVAALNNQFRRATGSREDLISGNTFAELQASFRERAFLNLKRIEEASQRANDKALDEDTRRQERENTVYRVITQLKNGDDTGAATGNEVEESWKLLRNDPASLATARKAQWARGVIDKVGQGDMRHAANQAVLAKDFQAFDDLYQNTVKHLLQPGPQAEAVMATYLGTGKGEHAAAFSTYHRLLNGSTDASTKAAAFLAALQSREQLSVAKDSLDVRGQAALREAVSRNWRNWFLDDAPAPGFEGFNQTRQVEDRLHPALWRLIKADVEASGLPVESAVPAVLKKWEQQGLEYAGGFFWAVPPGTKTLRKEVNSISQGRAKVDEIIMPEQFDNALSRAVASEVSKAGLNQDTIRVDHWSVGKTRGLGIWGDDRDGNLRLVTLTPQQIYDNEMAYRKRPEAGAPGIHEPGSATYQEFLRRTRESAKK